MLHKQIYLAATHRKFTTSVIHVWLLGLTRKKRFICKQSISKEFKSLTNLRYLLKEIVRTFNKEEEHSGICNINNERLKVKNIPVTGSEVQQGCEKLRLPKFFRQSTYRGRWRCQSYAPAALYTAERFLLIIFARGWVEARSRVGLKNTLLTVIWIINYRQHS
jgi:hypothetical protein